MWCGNTTTNCKQQIKNIHKPQANNSPWIVFVSVSISKLSQKAGYYCCHDILQSQCPYNNRILFHIIITCHLNIRITLLKPPRVRMPLTLTAISSIIFSHFIARGTSVPICAHRKWVPFTSRDVMHHSEFHARIWLPFHRHKFPAV